MQNIKNLVVLVAVFVSVESSGFGQPRNATPGERGFVSEDFFPLRCGNSWTYSSPGNASVSLQTRITDSVLIDHQWYFVYDGKMYPLQRDTLRADSAGSILIFTSQHWILSDPRAREFMLFDFSVHNGTSYPYLPYPTSSITLINVGSVTVPAGNFPDCVQLSFKGAMADDNVDFTFARGIGIVKISAPFYGRHELKSALVDGRTFTSAADRSPVLPASPELFQAFPNPFNPSTTIRYGLPVREHVSLSVFNTLGQQVSALVQGDQDAGYHEVTFGGQDLPSGMYFCRMQAGTFRVVKRILLVR